MKKLIVILALAGTIWACGGSDKPSESTASTNTPAIDAKKLYKLNCSTCHGLYGDMGASGAFNLTTSELNLEERKLVIAKGRGVMTAFEGSLDTDQIDAVAKYTLELTE